MHASALGTGTVAGRCCGAMTPDCMSRNGNLPCAAGGASCSAAAARPRHTRHHTAPFSAVRPGRRQHALRQQTCIRCEASEDDGRGTVQTEEGERIKRTLSGLDALLGIDPEEEARKKKKDEDEEAAKSAKKRASDAASRSTSSVDISVNPDLLEKIRKADEERAKNSQQGGENQKDGDKQEDPDGKVNDAIARIVELAKTMQNKKGDDPEAQEKEEKLVKEVGMLIRPTDFSRVDLDIIKQEVFTQDAFRITETQQLFDVALRQGAPKWLNGNAPGIYIAGTLRMPREQLFDAVYDKLRARFGDKYELFMVTDLTDGEDPRGGPRVAFQVIEGSICRPSSANNWQLLFAGVLAVFTAGSCLQLGVLSNLSLLPKETLDFFSDPNNAQGLDPNLPVPGLDSWDPTRFVDAVLPISLSVYGLQSLHEVSHRVVAALRKIKLGPSFFIPNGQLGTFGAVTPFKSMVRKRADLFDVAAAGPAAAGIGAAALFLAGLTFSAGGGQDLVPVPTQLFQGSLALGSLVQGVLGEQALSGASVPVHPFLIAGWAGLVSTALNLLPVGNIDGGRIVQGAFGRGALSLTSFLTYVGLGLGFLGSGLALPFGLYILIVQRAPEPVLLDGVTPPSSSRQVLAAALIFAAVLVLLPMAPGVAEDAGNSMGGPGMFL